MIGGFRTLYRAVDSFLDNDGMALAGYVAFSVLLGLFPFAILASNVATLFLGDAQGQSAIDLLFRSTPDHVAKTLEPVMRSVIAGSSGGVLTLSALAALWFSSNAFEALRTGFDRAYGLPGRKWYLGRLTSILCVFFSVFVTLFLGVAIIFGPILIELVETRLNLTVPPVIFAVRYSAGLFVFVIFLTFLHKVLPRRSLPLAKLLPGVLATTLIWIVIASGFSAYLAYAPSYASTYGALAGVAITLIFFNITAISVLFGAELNVALDGRKGQG